MVDQACDGLQTGRRLDEFGEEVGVHASRVHPLPERGLHHLFRPLAREPDVSPVLVGPPFPKESSGSVLRDQLRTSSAVLPDGPQDLCAAL
jgi:hypothetical protein